MAKHSETVIDVDVTEEPVEFIVGAFSYEDEKRADQAVKEQYRIEKLKAQVDYTKPKVVYALYQKILEGGVFETPEGIGYLLKLNEYLNSKQIAIGKEIPPIPESMLIHREMVSVPVEVPKKKKREFVLWKRIKENKEDPAIYKIIIAFLLVAIIIMLVLTGMSNSPTILNYKKQIQNEYSSWQQQLEEKERELIQRERQIQNL